MVRKDAPSIRVARAKVGAAEATLLKARLLWVPKASMTLAFAPSPKYKCVVPEAFRNVSMSDGSNLYTLMQADREKYCMGTDNTDTVSDFFKKYDPSSYWFRFELSLVQPIYTFGKIRYAKKLAHAGVEASRLRVVQARDRVVWDVRRAYFGLKLARELLFTIDEGSRHLKKAKKRVERLLAKDDDEVDFPDKYRLDILIAEVEDQTLRLKQAERLALAGMRALIGRKAARDLDVDAVPLAPVIAKVKPLRHYLDLARRRRPELRLLNVAVKASKAAVGLRTAKFLPDLGFILRFSSTYSTSEDNPQSAYLKDNLHGTGLFLGLTLKWDLDFHFKYADLAKARSQLVAARALREQASLGIEAQIEAAYDTVTTAEARLTLYRVARKSARKWLVTMSQRHDMGTVKTKQLTDALKAYFQTELKGHQAVYDLNLAVAKLSQVVGADVTSRWSKRE